MFVRVEWRQLRIFSHVLLRRLRRAIRSEKARAI